MAVEFYTFDGGSGDKHSPGLTLTVDRDGAAYQRDGTSIAADTARYATQQTVAGAPDWTAITATGAWRPLATGVAADGVTPVFVAREGTGSGASFDVHARGDPESFYNSGETTGTYATALGGTNGDLLAGQDGSNGETAAITDHEFYPNNAWVYDGLVVTGCEHFANSAGWDTTGCAMAHNTVARLAAGYGWVLGAVEENRAASTAGSYAQGYSGSGFVDRVSNPDRAYFAWTDYSTGDKQGGCANLAVFDRSGGAWSLTDVVRIADNFLTGSDVEHWHCAGVIFDASGNLHVVISVGDTLDYNRLIHRSLPAADVAAGNFGNGVTYSHGTYGDTGISGSYVIHEPHANWSAESVAFGGEDVTANHALRWCQAINFRQKDAACTTLLCGADVTASSVYELSWNESLGVPVLNVVFLAKATCGVPDGVSAFMVEGEPGGPFCARFCAEAGQWQDGESGGSGVTNLEGSALYSRDGDDWMHLANVAEAPQYGVCPHAGKVYVGAASGGSPGFFGLPVTRTGSPIQVCPTPANLMSAGLSAASFTGKSAGVTLTDLASDGSDLPADFNGELPPCDRTCMFTVVTGDATADRGNYGQATMSGSIAATWSSLCLKLWVRPILYDNSGYANKGETSVYVDFQCITGSARATTGGHAVLIPGQWVPITVWATPAQMSAALSDSTYRIRLRAISLTTTNASPCHFAVCLEGLFADSLASAAGTAPGSAALPETVAVDGFTAWDTWSAFCLLQIPDDAWDNRVGGGGTGTQAGTSMTATPVLGRFSGVDADTLDIKADPANNRLILASDAASTNGTANDAWFRRLDRVAAVVTCDGSQLVMHYLGADNSINTITVADALSFTRFDLVDPLWCHEIVVREGVDADPSQTLRMLARNGPWWDQSDRGRARARGRARSAAR